MLHLNSIRACERGRNWEVALQMLHDWRRRRLSAAPYGPPDAQRLGNDTEDMQFIGMFNSAFRVVDHAAQWVSALGLLACMRESALELGVVSYGAAISACDRAGRYVSALRLLEDMCEEGLEPDMVTYSIALGACRRELRELVTSARKKKRPERGRRRKFL
mmetsp:Transcript_84997/g.259565  ORF Transcript_84997/g.259565 Transcript_84997/m.259565 type:complete len:161 (-) Transcript_84997:105-587(-)